MILLVIACVFVYIQLGVIFAAWTNASGRAPEYTFSETDRDDMRAWMSICCLVWPVLIIGYFLMHLFDKYVEFFKKEDKE